MTDSNKHDIIGYKVYIYPINQLGRKIGNAKGNEEKMKKEIRVEARLRNNRLYHAIFDTYPSVAAFCKASGFQQTVVGKLLNLKMRPLVKRGKQKGEYRKICFDLAICFNVLPEFLFPLSLYSLKKVAAAKEFSFSELPGILQAQLLPESEAPDEILARKELEVVMSRALADLSPQEETVIRKSFGLEGRDEETLEEIGDEIGVSHERVRQIKEKSLRKLRHLEKDQDLKHYRK